MPNESQHSDVTIVIFAQAERRRPLAQQSSIAVLQLTNLDEQTEKDRSGAWLAGDVIHCLSKFRHLSVIGRQAAFAFGDGGTGSISHIGRTLGVRYLVTGSVQRTVQHIQIQVQLAAAASGKSLWRNEYHTDASCHIEVLDDLASTMATAIAVKVEALERDRLKARETDRVPEVEALVMTANHLAKQFKRSANNRARHLAETAIRIDPWSARACAVLSRTYHLDWRYAWASNPDKRFERAIDLASRAIECDPLEASGHAELGMNRLFQRDYESAYASYQRALNLNPYDPDILADFSNCLISCGDPESAIESLKLALDLNPEHANIYRCYLAGAFTLLGEHDTVIQLLTPLADKTEAHRKLAASYAHLGMREHAHDHAAAVMRVYPNFSLVRWRHVLPHVDASIAEPFFEGLARAGLH